MSDPTGRTAAATTTERARRRGRYWPIGIGVALALVAALDFCFLFVAATHPAFKVEPRYYERGLAWDEERAARQRDHELGWRIETHIDGALEARRRPELEARLFDADGGPIDGALVELTAFHCAHPKRIYRAQLVDRGEGSYAAPSPMTRPGLWDLRYHVRRGELEFEQRTTESLGGPR